MHPTPNLSHLSAEDYDQVYEPAEDSFLFLDALEQDLPFLQTIRPAICLEVGSGSGVVSTFMGTLLGPQTCYLCTDINPRAAEITMKTGAQNGVALQPVITDLCAGLLPWLEGRVDILLFNPPYVVTPPEEVGCGGITASWAGGVRGRGVMDRFFPLVPHLLSPRGAFYLVIIKENDEGEIGAMFQEQGLIMEVVKRRRSGPEHLSILKFTRHTSQGTS